MKSFLTILLTLALTACGGGGGGSSTTTSTPTTPVVAAVTINNVFDFPANNGINYGDQQYAFGHLGTSTGNCMVVLTVDRDASDSSSPSVAAPPLVVMCQQSNGNFAEVSQQLFGSQIFVNGQYPIIADFNNDGVDDLFIIQSYDGPVGNGSTTTAYTAISNGAGTYTVNQITINCGGCAQQAVVTDVNQDGCLDVVIPGGNVSLGNCHGSFTQANLTNAGQYYGTGNCTGALVSNGHKQIVSSGVNITGTVPATPVSQTYSPNIILDIDSSMNVVATYTLPVPYLNTLNNSNLAMQSDRCDIVDINNDGLPDIVIQTADGNGHGYTQVYLNQGNFQFQDVSATAFSGYNIANMSNGIFSPRFVDLNGDGYLDMAVDVNNWAGTGELSQVWLNNKNNTFTSYFTTQLNSLYNQYQQQYGTVGLPQLRMLPVKVNGLWNYMISMKDSNGNFHIGVANTQYSF